MSRTLPTPTPNTRWGIPLVLPHVLLSLGLLLFAFASERPTSFAGVQPAFEPAAATNTMVGRASLHVVGRS